MTMLRAINDKLQHPLESLEGDARWLDAYCLGVADTNHPLQT